MIYDSWVLTGFLACNVLLVGMTVAAYAYQWRKGKESRSGD